MQRFSKRNRSDVTSLINRATPFLEPGEEPVIVFPARTGLNPWWFVLNALPVLGWAILASVMIKAGPTRVVTIVTTDQATMVLSSKGRLKPASILFRGPLERLGDPAGIWGKIFVHGERYWVRRRYQDAVLRANDYLPVPSADPAPGPD